MSSEPDYQDIRAKDYKARFFDAKSDHFLLDVRTVPEYISGRIPGAVNIPMNEIPARMDEIPDDKPVVIVCGHGMRSIMVADYLVSAGFDELFNLVEGTDHWIQNGLPAEQG